MRLALTTTLVRLLIAGAVSYGLPAAVVDRTAVAVGNDAITESEILQEIRVVAFLNGEPPDSSAGSRRETAERLVDQYLIRQEMEISRYTPPEMSEAEAMLRKLREERFGSEAEYRAALGRYGITEEQVKRHLLWQLTALRFTDLRFRTALPRAETAPLPPGEQERADRSESPAPAPVDQQLEEWLKQARSRHRVVFMKEAFR
jgi:hypothetical protein